MTEYLFLYILIIHFLADFGLQTHDQATNKSSSIKWLLYHTGSYSVIWLIAMYIYMQNLENALLFAGITFILHTITDYITSRMGKPFWDKKDLHNGFVIVGFDQVLHYIQLFYTFKLIDGL